MKRRFKSNNPIGTSIIRTYSDFAENTSIHGLKYTVQKETSTFEKVLWIIIVLLGIAGAVFMLHLFWERFNSNPTRTSVKTTYAPTIEIPFPGITICNINTIVTSKMDNFIKKLELHGNDEEYVLQIFPQILAYTFSHEYNITDLEVLNNLIELNEFSVKKVTKRIGQGCREMLVKCKWESKIVDCKKYFEDTLTPDGLCCSFNYNLKNSSSIYTLYFGYQMGLTILLDPMVQEAQYSSLLSSGMKVTIHLPQNYPGYGNTEKILAIGRETLLQLDGTRYISSDAVRELTPEQRQCVISDEYNLHYFSKYSEENCLTECRANYILKNCGCLPYYYTFSVVTKYSTRPEAHLLYVHKYVQHFLVQWITELYISDKPVCDLTKIPCLAELRDIKNRTRFRNSHCDCPMQCEDIFYEVLSTSTKFVNTEYLTSSFLTDVNTTENSMLLHVFFSSQTQTILLRDTLTSTVYLLSSFGGIFSLFLGCSFISGAELIYYVCIRFFLNLQVLGKIETELSGKPSKNKKPMRSVEVLHGDIKGDAVYTLYGRNVFLN